MSIKTTTNNASAAETAQLYMIEIDAPIAGRGESHTLAEWARIYGHNLESAYQGEKLLKPLPANSRANVFAWSARCDCRNNHNSNSGRCNVRNVTDQTRTELDRFAACERCRRECPCGNGKAGK
jgi:hypothetical protein